MKLQSKAMPSSEGFKQNREAHLEALAQINEAAEAARVVEEGLLTKASAGAGALACCLT